MSVEARLLLSGKAWFQDTILRMMAISQIAQATWPYACYKRKAKGTLGTPRLFFIEHPGSVGGST
eukprot:1423357-Rhodomonas_salina.2